MLHRYEKTMKNQFQRYVTLVYFHSNHQKCYLACEKVPRRAEKVRTARLPRVVRVRQAGRQITNEILHFFFTGHHLRFYSPFWRNRPFTVRLVSHFFTFWFFAAKWLSLAKYVVGPDRKGIMLAFIWKKIRQNTANRCWENLKKPKSARRHL